MSILRSSKEYEEWRVIPKYPKYEVSSIGRVRVKDSKELLDYVEESLNSPYRRVRLKVDNTHRPKKKRVHLLMLQAFIGSRPTPAHISHHIDGNTKNNLIDNLVWSTPKEIINTHNSCYS